MNKQKPDRFQREGIGWKADKFLIKKAEKIVASAMYLLIDGNDPDHVLNERIALYLNLYDCTFCNKARR